MDFTEFDILQTQVQNFSMLQRYSLLQLRNSIFQSWRKEMCRYLKETIIENQYHFIWCLGRKKVQLHCKNIFSKCYINFVPAKMFYLFMGMFIKYFHVYYLICSFKKPEAGSKLRTKGLQLLNKWTGFHTTEVFTSVLPFSFS